jgi:hypothetical protein
MYSAMHLLGHSTTTYPEWLCARDCARDKWAKMINKTWFLPSRSLWSDIESQREMKGTQRKNKAIKMVCFENEQIASSWKHRQE